MATSIHSQKKNTTRYKSIKKEEERLRKAKGNQIRAAERQGKREKRNEEDVSVVNSIAAHASETLVKPYYKCWFCSKSFVARGKEPISLYITIINF